LPAGVKLNEEINQYWNRMRGAWNAFQTARAKLSDGDPATTITREKWLLPLFQGLDYGRLLASKSIEIESKNYAVSHLWQNTPIHLVGAGVGLAASTVPIKLLSLCRKRIAPSITTSVNNHRPFGRRERTSGNCSRLRRAFPLTIESINRVRSAIYRPRSFILICVISKAVWPRKQPESILYNSAGG
jgi:hypothetical protein